MSTSIKISRLLEESDYDLKLALVGGKSGLERRISSSRIQKPGLALTGFTEHLHAERVQVFGNLLLGKSGIGKSEIALDLVMKGHRLVADDIVDVTRRKAGAIYGAGNAIIQHHMEIRGLGIINIKDLFGVASVRERKKIEL